MYKTYASKFKTITAFAAVILLAACGENGEKPEGETAGQAQTTAASESIDIASKSEGTWGDLVYGNPDAPVTIVEYASLTCPHCANFAKNYFPQVKKQLLDTGKAKLVYRNFIMNRVDMTASAAARCSNAETTKKLMKVFFDRQYDWARSQNPLDELASLARRAGISRTQFDRCVNDQDMLKHLMQMTYDGQNNHNISSTPSFLVNGNLIEFSTFEEAIEQMVEAVDDAG